MAEGGGLLNRYTSSRRIEGSNPSVSANVPSSDIQGHPEKTIITGDWSHFLLFQIRGCLLRSAIETWVPTWV